MKRRILASLAFGLLLPWAMVWAMAALNMRPKVISGVYRVPMDGREYLAHVATSFAHTQFSCSPDWSIEPHEQYSGGSLDSGQAPYWLEWRGKDVDKFKEGENFQETVQAWGWPMHCLMSGVERRMDDQYILWGAVGPHNGVNLNRTVPYVPIWPGYLINTIIYTAAAFALLTLFAKLQLIRRGRKARRGICLSCGYHVGGLPTCPECGKENPASTSAAAEPAHAAIHREDSGE